MVHHSSSIPPLVGRTIGNGRLNVECVLGSGSNGVIYLARGKIALDRTEKQYAVKCLPKADVGSRLHYLQHLEVRFHLTMTFHQSILPIYSVWEEDAYLFLALQYCPGGDLFTFMSEHTTYRGNDMLVKSVFLQILDAVEACHNMGIFHRDLKPENILCNEDGSKVYLCDFGLATERPHSTSYGCGSSYYMSPECITPNTKFKPYSTRANDIWALGVILTSMITGHNPWHHALPTDACYVEYTRDPEFLIRMLPISGGAFKILKEIFRADPTKRITIPRLRQKIIGLDTFFATQQQIASGNPHLQAAAHVYYTKPSKPCRWRQKGSDSAEKGGDGAGAKDELLSEGTTAVHEVSPIMKSSDVSAVWEIPLSRATNSPHLPVKPAVQPPQDMVEVSLKPPMEHQHSFSSKFLQRLVDRCVC